MTTRSFRSAPNDEERAHHYLWRFWRHLSRAGRMTIFDRSWYGRVLVERVEGFAAERSICVGTVRLPVRRAARDRRHPAREVLDSYQQSEQLTRFRDRSRTSYKQWKITEEDWRNRKRWDDYTVAVNDMVARTSTKIAPGPWSKATTRTSRGSRCSGQSRRRSSG